MDMTHPNLATISTRRPENRRDADLHFTGDPLDGLKLIGFTVWARRDGKGQNVTFPARQFTVHGERRSFRCVLHDLNGTGPDGAISCSGHTPSTKTRRSTQCDAITTISDRCPEAGIRDHRTTREKPKAQASSLSESR